jgi:hypothetical protein
MKTLAFVLPAMLFCGCAADDPYGNFLGTYKTTLVLSASGSQTYTDTLSISEGQSADLILSSQQMGSMKATIIGDTSFSIDQQQITLTDGTNNITVTLQGQGTVSDGVLAASGQMSSQTAAFQISMNGSRQ